MKNTITVIVILIYSLIDHGYTQNTKCGLGKFRCTNGQCIESDLLCDGRPDCADKSDETLIECNKPDMICPDIAFRCSYGACVNGDAICNGIKDCIDNSDETLPNCNNSTQTSCSKNQFRCNDGQCIPELSLCDGIADCADSSDETFIKCGSIVCPGLFFHCFYGACIDANLKCNGVRNCVDGSDEDPVLCKANTTTVAPPIPIKPTTVSSTTWAFATCTVPPPPANGYRKLYKPGCCKSDGGQQCNFCDIPKGAKLVPGQYLVYGCNHGYKLTGGPSQAFCTQDGEWSQIPTCTEIYCEPLDSSSRSAMCRYHGIYASCQASVLPGTVANLKCLPSYRQDTTVLSTSDLIICNENGQWEPKPIQCIPECGVPAGNYIPLISNGIRPNISELPWHATLYREIQPNNTKEFICGATIIHEKFLVTAAHCVTGDTNSPRYYVATGNIFRDYDSIFHDPSIVKKAMVKTVYIPCNFIGFDGNYAEDIALLEIDQPFILTATLVPICLDVTQNVLQLEVGDYGKVAGFGRTSTGENSAILQAIEVPYISRSKCQSASKEHQTTKLITPDKFCAGYTNGTSVCEGDSGGGLVFKRDGVWYLGGIVSVSLGVVAQGGNTICNTNTYTLYTKVSDHVTRIRDVVNRRLSTSPCF
nr:PREDICTED: mannan-binding lectin serine protease 2-like isoform X1 [Megachile rotundata]XP_012149756.1 PREDICTED: mannan-binding lectin serine protease 2-like isoform X1 [Megachile rotundata]XP_012149757.1 PREDICTED: mannan-binding lectin serine protease 2-like isoform X1 [Megachile rotundata]